MKHSGYIPFVLCILDEVFVGLIENKFWLFGVVFFVKHKLVICVFVFKAWLIDLILGFGSISSESVLVYIRSVHISTESVVTVVGLSLLNLFFDI